MADIVTSRIFTDGERGITAAKLNDITGSSVIQPAFYSSKPTAPTADPADIALILKSGAYAQVPISTLAGSATQAQIWSTRLRSYNAIGNPNFEVDQRNVGGSFGILGGLGVDRWSTTKVAASYAGTVQQFSGAQILVPGTSFSISRSYWRTTMSAQQASLAAGDYHALSQVIEGPQFREIMADVHSVSLLVRSNVAGLNFGLYLRDVPATKTLTKLCTIPTANTWTLVTLPNIPVFPAGNFFNSPGLGGYNLGITLVCGTTYMSPANDTWQTGAFLGAVGQSNFANSPVNSTFDLGFVQHEPGAVCSTLMDKPFAQNLDECLRYYQKTYQYGILPGTVGATSGLRGFCALASATSAYGTASFHKTMAKAPTVVLYNYNTGAAGSVIDGAGANHSGATASNVGDSGFSGVSYTTATSGAMQVNAHYTADTGW